MTLGEVAYNEFKSWLGDGRKFMRSWDSLEVVERSAWDKAAQAVIANRHSVEASEPTAYGSLGGR